jgi:hypothetical protein
MRLVIVARMELNMGISIDAKDADPAIAKRIDEIVAEEAPTFVETIRRRLAAEGVTDLKMNAAEPE